MCWVNKTVWKSCIVKWEARCFIWVKFSSHLGKLRDVFLFPFYSLYILSEQISVRKHPAFWRCTCLLNTPTPEIFLLQVTDHAPNAPLVLCYISCDLALWVSENSAAVKVFLFIALSKGHRKEQSKVEQVWIQSSWSKEEDEEVKVFIIIIKKSLWAFHYNV